MHAERPKCRCLRAVAGRVLGCAAALLIASGVDAASSETSEGGHEYEVRSAYDGLDWQQVRWHKAALHVHTRESDGRDSVGESIEKHRELGFHALAITDHASRSPHASTWRWEDYDGFDEEPAWVSNEEGMERAAFYAQAGMLAIKANEIDTRNHMISVFSSAAYSGGDIAEGLEEVEARDGTAWFAHPGWHNRGDAVEYFLRYYDRFGAVTGLEVANTEAGNSYDTALWDALLMHYGEDRQMNGIAVTDDHSTTRRGKNSAWTWILAEDGHDQPGAIREAMNHGQMFWVVNEDEPLTDVAVRVDRIETRPGLIEIEVSGDYTEIAWIHDGEKLASGTRFTEQDMTQGQGYVRFEIREAGSYPAIEGERVLGSQPFYFGDG